MVIIGTMKPDSIQAAIDAKIRKLQMIKELACDPEALALMRELVSQSTPAPTPQLVRTAVAVQAVAEAQKKRAAWGEQQRITEEVLRSAKEPVTTDWIARKMQENGYVFKAQTPSIAVNDCLRTAKDKGRAKIARTEGITNYWVAVAS